MRMKRDWAETIIANIGKLRHNNLLEIQGLTLAPSGGINRYARKYLESEGGIAQTIYLREIWDSGLGQEIRRQLQGANYLKNLVIYELEPDILDRIAGELMRSSPKLVLRLVNHHNRIVLKSEQPNQPDSDHAVPSWPR